MIFLFRKAPGFMMEAGVAKFTSMNQLEKAKEYLISQGINQADTGIVLGTGLHQFIKLIEVTHSIPYSEIPYFLVSTVEFNKGYLIYGRIGNKKVLVMQGRFHAYEGYNMAEIIFPIWVMKLFGIIQLFLSNAAGGINLKFKKSELILIEDNINLQSGNPLTGKILTNWAAAFLI